MKIMQIVADGTPGGGTTNVLALTEDLIAEGINVAFCSQKDSYALEEAKRLGANVVDGIDFFRRRVDSRVAGDLRRAVIKADPDIVHVHGGRAAFAWLRGAERVRFHRTIYTVRGYQFWRKPFPTRMLAKYAERRFSRSFFKTVHVSTSDQNVAVQQAFVRNASSSRVIRNGINLSDITRILADVSLERRNDKHIAVLGRLTEAKNPHLVLDLAQELQGDGFVFHLIGGGDMEGEVKARVEVEHLDNVVLHGNQPRDEGLRLMSQSGTFLLASFWEGLPIAPVEAMAMGLAVVISDVNGCTEVVRDGIEGRVVPSGNQAAFAAALRAVISEPEKTKLLIENGKHRVASEFTRDRVVRQHLELYRECLEHS